MNNFFSRPTNQKQKQNSIIRDFLTEYNASSMGGVINLAKFYCDDTQVTIDVRAKNNRHLFETTGFSAFFFKLSELGIHHLRFYNFVGNSQTIGNDGILINFQSLAQVGAGNYDVRMIIAIKKSKNKFLIANQIFEIYV